jgi:hypothetical protein
MADRVLTWSFNRFPEGGILTPAYYMEADYAPLAVRTHALSVPKVNDAEFDIMVDGVSIFVDRDESEDKTNVNYQIQHVPDTSIPLSPNDGDDAMADNFRDDLTLEEGSWVTCKVVTDSGARNVTIQFELQAVSESDEESE